MAPTFDLAAVVYIGHLTLSPCISLQSSSIIILSMGPEEFDVETAISELGERGGFQMAHVNVASKIMVIRHGEKHRSEVTAR